MFQKLNNNVKYIRFHHIMQVIKNTGFLDGLYTDAELNHQNIKDKAAKIDFLTKTVDAVSKFFYIYIYFNKIHLKYSEY